MVEQLVAAKPAPSGPQSAHWSCPPLLGVKSVGTLTDVLARTSPPWRLDWTRLAAIEPTALPTLVKLLHGWADQPIELSLTGADQLEKMLENGSPSGDATVAPDWWHARMALLRVMSRMDDFELAALNYCVTYEVSPPSWEHPRCTCDFTSGDSHERGGPVTIISSTFDLPSDGARDAGHSDFRSTGMESELLPPLVVELSGSIAGDVSSTLMTLESKFAGADTLTISCSKLIRVDFAAAGTLLNWVSALHSQGRQVQFKGVHRLILGFFNVIGISELARITVRTD